MRLADLIHGLDVRLLSPAFASMRVCDIAEDSRTVLPGSLFIARAGTKEDGRKYVHQAILNGAVAVLSDRPIELGHTPHDVAMLVSSDVPGVVAEIAERFYDRPSRKLTMLGVTGTNGKTTIAYLTHQLLNAARKRCGLISTVSIDDGREVADASMTTPPAIEISQTLATMVEHGCVAATMEVSSHALDQQRVGALEFNIACFTNLTGDHLDYHGTMENYAAAKARLFESLRPSATAVVNADDPWHERMTRDCAARIVRCTMSSDRQAEARVIAGPATMSGSDATFEGPWGRIHVTIPLVGSHNLMNVLQSIAMVHAAGIDRATIEKTLAKVHAPPGRLERVTPKSLPSDPGFAVFVDYAHTDDALANVLRTLQPLVDRSAGGKLRVVFGCGGDRDRTKRPRMARVACELADAIVITSDNPRTENPDAIIREVSTGVPPGDPRVHRDADRTAAITHAINECHPGDILIIAGKGHETYQLLPDGAGGIRRIDFDDRIVAADALEARFGRRHTVRPARRHATVPEGVSEP